ncbi:MAG TPA: Ig-like domain-containing protein [Solirubrobacterales bacterium]|nr:Ig-like domain-containing protein [Solirubrobacterales bacterium]
MRLVGSRFKVCLAAICALALLPATAQAITIDGDQLDIMLDPDGNVQVLAFGQTSRSFFPPSEEVGDAGFFVGLPDGTAYGPPIAATSSARGSEDIEYSGGVAASVTGSGTTGSPYKQVTTYEVPGKVKVTQTTTYVNGERSFKQRFELENTSGGSLQYRASVAADLFLEGSDDGVGFFTPGPPKIIGGLSEATERAGGLREVAGFPWSAYQELSWPTVWYRIFESDLPGFNNSIDASLVDNAIGVQWDEHYSSGLSNGAIEEYEIEWRFGLGGLTASPPSAHRGTGSFHQVTLTATDANGDLISGGTIRYEISGANPESGSKKTAGNGKAKVGWVGDNAGTDTLNAYLDEDGDKKQDPGEPEASANAVFVDPETNVPPPPPIPNMPSLELQGQPILQNGTTTLVVVVPSAGQLTVQQANGGGKAGGKKSSASVSVAGAELFAKRNKAAKGKRGKGKKGKRGKRGKRRRPSLIRRAVKRPKQAGPVRIKIRSTKFGRKVLNKRGKFTVKVRVAFVAAGTKQRFAFTRKVTVKKKVGKGKRGKGKRGKGKSRGKSRRR